MEQIITGPQIKAARNLLGWYQADLAEKAGVSRFTVQRLETSSKESMTGTYFAVVNVLTDAGIQFTDGGVKRNA